MYYRVVVAAAAPHQMEVSMTDVDAFGAGKVKDAKIDHVIAIVGGRRGIVGEVLDEINGCASCMTPTTCT